MASKRKTFHISPRTCNQEGELRVNFARGCTYVHKTFYVKIIFMAGSLMFINIYEVMELLCVY